MCHATRDGLAYTFPGYTWDWTSMAEYLARLRQARPSINVISLVGHSALRTAVMGQSDRPPTPEELAAMQRLLAQALAEGTRVLQRPDLYALLLRQH